MAPGKGDTWHAKCHTHVIYVEGGGGIKITNDITKRKERKKKKKKKVVTPKNPGVP